MFTWAWKSLFSQRGSLIGSTLGVASAFILVLFFEAVWRGESEQIVAYPSHVKPDVWVMQSGVSNMHMAMSFVWDWKADRIAQLPGVKRVTPITYLSTVIGAGNEKLFAFVVGLLPSAEDRAGPWKLSAGRKIQNRNEAVIPDVLSKITDVNIGDKIRITDKSFTVVGLSSGTYSSANAVLFVPFKDLEDILSSSGTYSFLLVDAMPGVDADKLAQQIQNSVEKVHALSHKRFIKNDFAMASQMGVEIIVMMTIICGVLAVLIIGFSAYTLVARKRREIAIAKALGTTNHEILFGVIVQSLIVTAFGFLIAVLFTVIVVPMLPALVPQITVVVSTSTILQLGLVAFCVAIVGAMIPAFLVVRLDPAIAFQV